MDAAPAAAAPPSVPSIIRVEKRKGRGGKDETDVVERYAGKAGVFESLDGDGTGPQKCEWRAAAAVGCGMSSVRFGAGGAAYRGDGAVGSDASVMAAG